jgi:glucose/arabinose dehydrogenase
MIRFPVSLPATALLGAALMLPACVDAQDNEDTGDDVHVTHLHAYTVHEVAGGLENPWSMDWLPNGDMLVTERPGRIRIVRNGMLLPGEVEGVPTVRARGQGGLLEVKVHPDFARNQYLYLTMSKPSDAEGSEGTTALMRGKLVDDRLTDLEELFEAKAWSGGGNHFGSRIVFDGNGHLFMTVGDRGARPDPATVFEHPAQDRSNHQGTVLRLNEDGTVPSDNPFVGQSDMLPEIWSYGHRNPQGLAMHPETGDLWDTEHAPQGGDEVNLVLPGLNYGWPVIGWGLQYGGSVIHESTHRDGMQQPRYIWVPSIGASGLMIYDGDQFPLWRGNLFAGGLAGENIGRLMLDGQSIIGEERVFDGMGRVRDIRQGPDGFIYVATEHRGAPSSIYRLEPAPMPEGRR